MLTRTPIFHCRAEAGRYRTGVLTGQGGRAPLPSSADKRAATGRSLPDPQDSSRSLCLPPPTLQPNNNPSPVSQGVSSRILHRNSGQKRARDTSTNTPPPQAPCSPRGLAGIRGGGLTGCCRKQPQGEVPTGQALAPRRAPGTASCVTCTGVDEGT